MAHHVLRRASGGWRALQIGSGSIIASRYRVVRVIGQGGMGTVYEAVNLTTHARVALKVLEDEPRRDPELCVRFSREARATGRVRSRFVARIFDHEVPSDGPPFLAMELLDGRDLRSELQARGGRLYYAEACAYVLMACAGVAAAHDAGVIHRDLKPGNLFLEAGAEPVVRVLDFGVSKLAGEKHKLTASRDVLGTTSYMPPEQLRASRNVDPRSDVWALGMVLYRAIEGRLPFHGTGPEKAARVLDDRPLPRVSVPGVPRELVKLIARALEKSPAGRPPDARALARALAPFAKPLAGVRIAREEIERSSPTVIVDLQTMDRLTPLPARP